MTPDHRTRIRSTAIHIAESIAARNVDDPCDADILISEARKIEGYLTGEDGPAPNDGDLDWLINEPAGDDPVACAEQAGPAAASLEMLAGNYHVYVAPLGQGDFDPGLPHYVGAYFFTPGQAIPSNQRG